MSSFKRVLIISNTPITPYSAQGASRGSWFKDWDKDSLAHITFCDYKEKSDFCNYYFTITRQEKKFLRFLKKGNSNNKQNSTTNQVSIPKTDSKKSLKKYLFLLINALTFPRYSKNLKSFIDEFKPDIVFTSIADCYASRLTLKISKKQNIPYITQQEDNWLTTELDNNMISKIIHRIRLKTIKKVCASSAKNYVICPQMERIFTKMFNSEFECLFCADDFTRFLEPVEYDPNQKNTFLYIGNSQPDRSSGFVTIAKAIDELDLANPEFLIYSNNASTDHIEQLKKYDFVKFIPHVHHNEVPKVISKANVLILCESFKPENIEYMSLALSSKAQIYMMSKIPSLVFASKKTGIADYAIKTGFAHVVSNNDLGELKEGVFKITYNTEYRKKLADIALNVAKQNHDAIIVRQQLKEDIYSICENH